MIMAEARIHARNSVKRWGGKEEDYIAIHDFMDSSKGAYAHAAHRMILHNSFASQHIIPRVFGRTITNSDGREISTKDIAEQHIMEDYGYKFIPTLQDWCENLTYQPWMNNGRGGIPNSAKPLFGQIDKTVENSLKD
jgi:hypothetical protein